MKTGSDPTVADAGVFDEWPGHTGNWNRWPNDLGTLNLVTPAVVMRGISSARSGEVIPCSRKIARTDSIKPRILFEQKMDPILEKKGTASGGVQITGEQLTFRVHNLVNTHLDAFSHVAYKGFLFNGRSHSDVCTVEEGAKAQDVTSALGVVTRGLLLDVARQRGVAHLQPGELVRPEDLVHFVDSVEPGDAVLIRTGATLTGGRHSAEDERGIWTGIHSDCIEMLGERGIAVIGADATEAGPSAMPEHCQYPFHVMCMVVYGIHIIHSMDLELLASKCFEKKRNDFLFMVGALNVPGATGSPVTPVAVM